MKRSIFARSVIGRTMPNRLTNTTSDGLKKIANIGTLISANTEESANLKSWVRAGGGTMHRSKYDIFTPEELEEIRRADIEIEREINRGYAEANSASRERRKLKLKKKTQNHRYYLKSRQRRLEYAKAYYEKNREEILKKANARYQRRNKRVLKQKQAYREKNREALRQKSREYYQKNREAIREKQRAYQERKRSEKNATD